MQIHTHKASNGADVTCTLVHQLTDNMTQLNATRLFEQLMKVGNVQPWHKQLGLHLVGKRQGDSA